MKEHGRGGRGGDMVQCVILSEKENMRSMPHTFDWCYEAAVAVSMEPQSAYFTQSHTVSYDVSFHFVCSSGSAVLAFFFFFFLPATQQGVVDQFVLREQGQARG